MERMKNKTPKGWSRYNLQRSPKEWNQIKPVGISKYYIERHGGKTKTKMKTTQQNHNLLQITGLGKHSSLPDK